MDFGKDLKNFGKDLKKFGKGYYDGIMGIKRDDDNELIKEIDNWYVAGKYAGEFTRETAKEYTNFVIQELKEQGYLKIKESINKKKKRHE